MPRYKEPPSLQEVCCKEVSSLLLTGCQTLDRRWEEPDIPLINSPVKSPVKSSINSVCREELVLSLPADQREVLDWMVHLPDIVVERVVSIMLEMVETQLLEDKDRKLIMTLINIEKMRVNDFFFGVHSLLSIVQGCRLQNLHFSKRLWFCLWEYGEITGSKRLSDTLCLSLPGLTNLTSLNIPHVANDRIVFTVSRYLTLLNTLDLSSSRVTDRGLKFLSGQNNLTSPVRSGGVNRNVIRNLTIMLDIGSEIVVGHQDIPEMKVQETQDKSGCCLLERLNLQSCDGVTEAGVRNLLDSLENLHSLEYHQVSSVLEILIKWTGSMSHSQREQKKLNLMEVEHGFPYSLSPFSEQMEHLANLCPRLTTLTLVTQDSIVSLLALFPNLINLNVELEDYLGEGFLSLLEKTSLNHLSVSCSSDPDVSFFPDDQLVQQGQLFNLATLSVGLLAPTLTKLSVSGCGLVSLTAVQKMDLIERLSSPSWLRRQNWFSQLSSLLLMSYEDTTVTINSILLRTIIRSARSLEVLNLEGNFGSFFTDTFVSNLLGQGALVNLHILDISACDQGGIPGRVPLTLDTARTVINRCPQLKELRMSDWNITDQQFQQLEQLVMDNNWDLKLTRRLAGQG